MAASRGLPNRRSRWLRHVVCQIEDRVTSYASFFTREYCCFGVVPCDTRQFSEGWFLPIRKREKKPVSGFLCDTHNVGYRMVRNADFTMAFTPYVGLTGFVVAVKHCPRGNALHSP